MNTLDGHTTVSKNIHIVDVRHNDIMVETKRQHSLLASLETLRQRDNSVLIDRHIWRLEEFTENAWYYRSQYASVWLVVQSGYYRIYAMRERLSYDQISSDGLTGGYDVLT